MCRFTIGTLLLTCFACLAGAQGSDGQFVIRQLLQRYTENYGGLRDANRLASISIQGVQIQQGVEYALHIRKKRPSSIRYQLERGGTTLISIYNGQQGWLETKGGGESSIKELSGRELEILKSEARFESPLYRHLEKPQNKITLEGREEIGIIQAYVLRVKEPDTGTSLYFLHPENSHVLRIDRLNDAGEVTMQTLFRGYKEVGGYPFAHEVENRIDGETVSITKLDSIIVNPGLLSFYFENPGD